MWAGESNGHKGFTDLKRAVVCVAAWARCLRLYGRSTCLTVIPPIAAGWWPKQAPNMTHYVPTQQLTKPCVQQATQLLGLFRWKLSSRRTFFCPSLAPLSHHLQCCATCCRAEDSCIYCELMAVPKRRSPIVANRTARRRQHGVIVHACWWVSLKFVLVCAAMR